MADGNNSSDDRDNGVNVEDDIPNNSSDVSCGKIDISSATDEKHALVCAMQVMNEGHLLVCDSANKKVKFFDEYSEVLSEVILSSEPRGMAVFSQSSIIVSLPNEKCLQKLSIDEDNEIILQGKIKTNLRCNKLVRYQEFIIAHAYDDTHRFFNIMDKDGHEIRCILTEARGSSGLFNKIRFISISPDNKTLYVTDEHHGCLGLSMNGEVLFREKGNGTPNHWGIATDTRGFLYLSAYDEDKIVVIDNKGEKIKDMVKVKHLKPCAISYSEADNFLYVKKGSSDLVLLFRCED